MQAIYKGYAPVLGVFPTVNRPGGYQTTTKICLLKKYLSSIPQKGRGHIIFYIPQPRAEVCKKVFCCRKQEKKTNLEPKPVLSCRHTNKARYVSKMSREPAKTNGAATLLETKTFPRPHYLLYVSLSTCVVSCNTSI